MKTKGWRAVVEAKREEVVELNVMSRRSASERGGRSLRVGAHDDDRNEVSDTDAGGTRSERVGARARSEGEQRDSEGATKQWSSHDPLVTSRSELDRPWRFEI